ncbi:hypothetical protein KIPE111705_02020 [Kibdelosporangium persicum]|uniref:Lipoprotein n=1 Tax=Kibdelosporangium persicum TaxID=2698649 RepID=A0ABX2F3N6_9PSEU|nr:hypothetical protein [Kibdelosporangium persicum]NRN65950.1 hypothetical protein [Kibdelosporangium persicum]
MRRLALGLVCLGLLAGCATAGGVRVEGAASQVTPPPSTPAPPSGATPSFDPVALLRADTKVSDKIKSHLTPCAGGRFPVDSRYVDVTGDGVTELIVSVMVCDLKPVVDNGGLDLEVVRGNGFIANYVYDILAKPPVALLALEEPGMILDQSKDGVVQIIHWQYRAKDPSCCPSQQVYKFFRWTGTTFEQFRR